MASKRRSSPSSIGSTGRQIRGIVLSLVINGAIPFILYLLLRPHMSEVAALIISALVPALGNIISLVRLRHLDAFGTFVLATLILSILLVFLGGSAKLILIRDSLLTGAFGLGFLASLLFPRPIMFYFGRHFSSGNDPAREAEFNALWQHSNFRFVMRLMTGVWGLALSARQSYEPY